MSVSSQQVPVGTTVTRIDPTSDGVIPQGSCLVRNRGSASVFIGAINVTTTTGYELSTGEAVTADLRPGDALYAIAASGTQTVHVLEVGGR